jgi:hypothetical protein
VHLASLGYRLQLEFSSRSRSRCSEGGFGLWLGDEGIVVVKRAHNPLYSNILNFSKFSLPSDLVKMFVICSFVEQCLKRIVLAST